MNTNEELTNRDSVSFSRLFIYIFSIMLEKPWEYNFVTF